MQKEREKISEYYLGEHKRSQQKIKYGMICIIAIPLFFLILMFTMKSSKLVYLILWIAALFIISAYLISVEYKDYIMQKQLKEFIGEDAASQPLIEIPDRIELAGLEDKKDVNVESLVQENEMSNLKKVVQENEITNPRKEVQEGRTADLEREIQMLREIAQLRTQLGMGDYSSLYKEDKK